MRQALAGFGLALAIVSVPASGWAGDFDPIQAAITAADLFSQRQDVQDVLVPPPPNGPATPIPFCSPGSPVCP